MIMTKKIINVNSFSELVDIYNKYQRNGMIIELESTALLLQSANFTNEEKAEILLMGGHQWHLRMSSKKAFRDNILKILAQAKLWNNNYNSFEDLYKDVDKLFCKTKYIGPLTKYDIAKRLSNSIINPCPPSTFTYLASHSLDGARILFGEKVVKKSAISMLIKTAKFTHYFGNMSALDIENILCINRDTLVFLKKKTTVTITIDILQTCHCINVNIKLIKKIQEFFDSIPYVNRDKIRYRKLT